VFDGCRLLFRLCRSVVFDEIRQLATAALSAADVVRRITLRRLKETFGHTKLQVKHAEPFL
jgi:hypothetical protein